MSAPTLTELRRHVFRHSPPRDRPDDPPAPEIGNWLARRVGRPSALYGTWLAVRLGVSANQVTTLALVANLAAAVLVATGSRRGFVAGIVLVVAAYWLDHVDGQVARWRRSTSLGGVYFDFMMHHVANLVIGFALGFGLAVRTGAVLWSAAGFLVGAGWLFLGLHNDCRYKAIFARLKGATREYRAVGGGGERPAPPASWPRSGPGLISWPLQKICEPHVVLLALVALASVAIVSAETWELGLGAYVAGMAVLAPVLALARGAKCILLDAPGAEFERWFRVMDDPGA